MYFSRVVLTTCLFLYSVNEIRSEKVLRRKRRYLIFPKDSSLQLGNVQSLTSLVFSDGRLLSAFSVRFGGDNPGLYSVPSDGSDDCFGVELARPADLRRLRAPQSKRRPPYRYKCNRSDCDAETRIPPAELPVAQKPFGDELFESVLPELSQQRSNPLSLRQQ